MHYDTKHNVLGVLVDGVDYKGAVDRIIDAAEEGRPFAGTSFAVHGVVEGTRSPSYRYRLNKLDLATADGQPVRWALRLLHGVHLPERVYGPTLMLHVLEAAAEKGLPVYFYGSTPEIVDQLTRNMQVSFPGLQVAGYEPSKFRRLSPEEKRDLIARIRASGAKLVYVGLGCPRQEVFLDEMRDSLEIPLIAVGAGFAHYAGALKLPPEFIQRAGLHWVYRLMQEPRRLWRRYLFLNPTFVALVALQYLGLWDPDPENTVKPFREVRFG
jgi:N-acetylglucosaminyldiphosphoundecaprenol N-acetyl-beta-D-mannosaminyltransferase